MRMPLILAHQIQSPGGRCQRAIVQEQRGLVHGRLVPRVMRRVLGFAHVNHFFRDLCPSWIRGTHGPTVSNPSNPSNLVQDSLCDHEVVLLKATRRFVRMSSDRVLFLLGWVIVVVRSVAVGQKRHGSGGRKNCCAGPSNCGGNSQR